jgi:hypothetical protein
MPDGSLAKSLIVTAPIVAAVVISLSFGVSAAVNPKPTATFMPSTTISRPPTTTAKPPPTTPVPTSLVPTTTR